MTSICLAILAVTATLLFDAVTALADALGRRDDLNFRVSPPSHHAAAEAWPGRSAPAVPPCP